MGAGWASVRHSRSDGARYRTTEHRSSAGGRRPELQRAKNYRYGRCGCDCRTTLANASGTLSGEAVTAGKQPEQQLLKTSLLGATRSRWSSARLVTQSVSSLSTVPLRLLAAICIIALPALSQVRGVYPLGMSATNSGVTPETGISYVNQFLFYS